MKHRGRRLRFWASERRCDFIRRNFRSILGLAAVGTVVGGVLTSRLGLESDLAALLPDSFESVKALKQVQEKVGGVGVLRVVISTDDFDAALRLAENLEPKLEASRYVRSVEYRNDVEFYEKYALLFLDTLQLDSLYNAIDDAIAKEKQKLNPFLVEDLFGEEPEEETASELDAWEERYRDHVPKRYYTNADSTVLVLEVLPASGSADLEYIRAMRDDVQRIIAAAQPATYAPHIQVLFGGNIQNRIVEFETVRKDIFGTAFYGVSAVFVLIAIFFHSIVAAVLVAGSLVGALAWTFGLTYLILGQLNTITGFLFVILFGLGIDYGIHAFARYRENRQAGMGLEEAMRDMVCSTGAALTTTAVTTSAAFFSLMLLDFRGFSELGLIAGIGLLFSLAAMTLVLPALVMVADKMGLLRFRSVERREERVQRGRLRWARPVVVGGSVLAVLAAYAATRVQFEYDFTELRVVTREREEVSELTKGVFTRSESPAVVLADTPEEMKEVVQAVRRIKAQDTISPTIDQVRSILSVVPDDQPRRLERIARIRELVDAEGTDLPSGDAKRRIDELRKYLAVDRTFTWDDLPEAERRRLVDKDGNPGQFVLIYPSVALRDGRNAIRFREDVGTIRTASGATYHAASPNIILAEMLIILTREGRIAVVLSLLVVFVIVSVQFHGVRGGGLVMLPLVVGLIATGGAMWALGMKLNFFNIVVLPSLVGIGVDSGVHLYHRYLEEGRGSLSHVLRHTGLAVGMATLTTMVGFSGLLFADHPGLRSIGKLALVGLTLTFLSAIVLFPALLQVLEDRGAGRGGGAPEAGADPEEWSSRLRPAAKPTPVVR